MGGNNAFNNIKDVDPYGAIEVVTSRFASFLSFFAWASGPVLPLKKSYNKFCDERIYSKAKDQNHPYRKLVAFDQKINELGGIHREGN